MSTKPVFTSTHPAELKVEQNKTKPNQLTHIMVRASTD